MIKKPLLLFLTLCLTSLSAYTQHIYKEKFEGCSTKQFALESQNKTAKKDNNELINFLTGHIPNNIRQKLRGKLKLQIIVYKDGTSCLLSYENNTKIKSNQLNIKQIKDLIDTELVWMNGVKNVSALAELEFKKKKISLKRYGMDSISGWHELKE